MIIMKMRDTDIQPFLVHLAFLAGTKWKGKNGVLAKDAGISGGYLSEVLKGKKIPSEEVAIKLSAACGYKYEKFLEDGFRLVLKNDSPCNSQNNNFTGGVFFKAVKNALEDLQQETQPNDIENQKAKKNARHHKIIDQFKNHELATEINIKLVELEQYSAEE